MVQSLAAHAVLPWKTVRHGQTFIFPIEDLLSATKEFSQENVIGAGQFGTVYKGFIYLEILKY